MLMTRISKIFSVVLIALFSLLLMWPLLEPEVKLLKPLENTENRALAEEPEFDVNRLDPFPAAYEQYYNDHFPFRNHLARTYSWLDFFVFDKNLYPDRVIVGDEYVMFPIKLSLDHFLGIDLMDAARLDTMRLELKRRKDFLAERNIPFIIVIAPEKFSVMSDALPGYVVPADSNKADQFARLIRELRIPLLDLRPYLDSLQRTDEEPFYYKNDTHWNPYGAFMAYRRIVQTAQRFYPQLPVLSLDDFTLQRNPHAGGNLVDLIAMKQYLNEELTTLTPRFESTHTPISNSPYQAPPFFQQMNLFFAGYEMANDTLPSVLVVRDSFTQNLLPYMSESFGRSVFIWDGWHLGLNAPIVEKEKPDLYMLIVLESLVDNMVKYQGE
jgi:hypothetical protein